MTAESSERWLPLQWSDEHRDVGAELRSVVRVFPDYIGTVLWFVHGPVDSADAKVSAPLADAMRAWEESYEAGLDDDFQWRSPDLEERHDREGLRLARALSAELGDAFEVEVFARNTEGHEARLRIRSAGPGTNPDAVEAFRRWAAESAAEDAAIRAQREAGGSLGWTVSAPLGEADRGGDEDWERGPR